MSSFQAIGVIGATRLPAGPSAAHPGAPRRRLGTAAGEPAAVHAGGEI
jgi:hypothetical protein